ncbi:MAG TPA: OmpA family protein [Chthoniobacterales bacterium]
MKSDKPALTPLGVILSLLLVAGLILGGFFVLRERASAPAPGPAPTVTSSTPTVANPTATANDEAVAPIEALAEAPKLGPAAPYLPKDNIIDIELSEYAGYAGLIAANGGLAPNENSYFFKKHGFKVRIALSEEESWSALNAGKMAASATTVDVLAVYGRQFNVVVPVQIGFSRGADGVVVRSDIRRVNGLKGKVIATSQFTEADFFIRYLAQEAGIGIAMLSSLDETPDPEKINLIYCEDAFAAGDLFLEDIKSGANRLAGCVTWAPKTTEVAEASGGRADVLVTNRNLLIVADILVVNKPFAQANPAIVAGLVDGTIHGAQLLRTQRDAQIPVVAKAFGWSAAETREELDKVHFSNLPEDLAFFSGAIDSAGSYGGIYQSAVYAYGPQLIPDPVDASRFLDLAALQALEKSGAYADQKMEIVPLRSGNLAAVEDNPLLSKDIRFFFEPNSSVLDLNETKNFERLDDIRKLLQVSPGSTVLLRGHVDDAMVPEFRRQGGEAFVRKMALKAMELSKNRAAEIQRLLVEREKIAPARIEVVGRGWEEPVGDSSDQKRRVEVQWFTVE